MTMRIKIKESGVKKELSLIDPKSGVDWISDFVGNAGALIDGQFQKDDDDDLYVCDLATFDWWQRIVNKQQSLDDRISDLIAVHCSDRVYAAVENAEETDLEMQADCINAALDAAFGDD